MNNLDEFAQWLNDQEAAAEKYLDEARQHGETASAQYWVGYGDAMANAAAAYYGPTPLDSEGN